MKDLKYLQQIEDKYRTNLENNRTQDMEAS